MLTKIISIFVHFFILILGIVLYIIVSAITFVTESSPIFFSQKRVGKGGKIFTMYKFRTMVEDAESQKNKLMGLNEADGPVFKIYNDPRFTKFGKILSRSGLDELPQLINIIKREMNLVGPRPLPVDEAFQIPKKYKIREKILPGIISPWVVQGMHSLSFKKWMELDCEYVKKHNLIVDINIIYKSALIVVKNMLYLYKYAFKEEK